jgi:hypothetical protein
MSTTEVLIFVLAFAALGFSLYKRFIKKDQDKAGYGQNRTTGSSFSSTSKDDDYEPYSKK